MLVFSSSVHHSGPFDKSRVERARHNGDSGSSRVCLYLSSPDDLWQDLGGTRIRMATGGAPPKVDRKYLRQGQGHAFCLQSDRSKPMSRPCDPTCGGCTDSAILNAVRILHLLGGYIEDPLSHFYVHREAVHSSSPPWLLANTLQALFSQPESLHRKKFLVATTTELISTGEWNGSRPGGEFPVIHTWTAIKIQMPSTGRPTGPHYLIHFCLTVHLPPRSSYATIHHRLHRQTTGWPKSPPPSIQHTVEVRLTRFLTAFDGLPHPTTPYGGGAPDLGNIQFVKVD